MCVCVSVCVKSVVSVKVVRRRCVNIIALHACPALLLFAVSTPTPESERKELAAAVVVELLVVDPRARQLVAVVARYTRQFVVRCCFWSGGVSVRCQWWWWWCACHCQWWCVGVTVSQCWCVCVSLSVSGGVLASVSVAVDLCTKSSGGVVCSFESERRKVTRQGKARQDNSTPVQH